MAGPVLAKRRLRRQVHDPPMPDKDNWRRLWTDLCPPPVHRSEKSSFFSRNFADSVFQLNYRGESILFELFDMRLLPGPTIDSNTLRLLDNFHLFSCKKELHFYEAQLLSCLWPMAFLNPVALLVTPS